MNRAKEGFFLRAESFFNLGSEIERLDVGDSYGGRSLHEQSHGESFFALFDNRLRGDGLYIFDEPEAALSPNRQLSFLVRMHELIGARSQFIIATHSPILMAYPGARIFQVSKHGLETIAYEDTEHFRITRSFLNRHELMIEQLFAD